MDTEGKKEVKRQPNKDHDDFARGLLSLPQLAKKLLLYALDKTLKRFVNFDTLRPLSGDHIDKFLRITHSDSIHACDMMPEALSEKGRLLGKIPQFRFVFIWEHKSVVQSLPIDFQVEGYNDSMMRMDFRHDKEALSIVHPILIYHGKDPWVKKRRYDHFEPYLAEELLAYIPHPKMTVIDIQAMSNEDIAKAIDLGELRAAFTVLKNAHDEEFFKQDIEKVVKFVHESEMQPKELLDTYLQMLYEYMQRRSKLDSQAFQKVVEQSNSKEMVAEFKTVFQVAREEGKAEGKKEGEEKGRDAAISFAIKGFINKTRLGDAVIADTLDVSVALVKTIREELKAEKAAKKAVKPKTQKPLTFSF